jgi:fatty acid desaturase
MHEAAHHNIAPTREANDWLANLAIGSWIGLAIEAYRPIHFAHHRHLGTTRDTERSYFTALTGRLIVESLTGVHVLRVLIGRVRDRNAQEGDSPAQGDGSWWPLLQGLLMHGAIVGAALLTGRYAFVAAWVLGIATAFPFFATIRQIIEHRRLDAPGDIDFASIDHGEINRLFGDGPLASTLGGAGFNRHMLHHWDPQLSYTRLHDLERFLTDTSVGPLLESARTSYPETFLALLRAPRTADPEWR